MNKVILIVSSCLDASYDCDLGTLMEIRADEVGRLSPRYAADKVCLALTVLILELPVNRDRESAYSYLRSSILNFRILCKSSD